MNKEEYIEYVREYKQTLHVLVPFQRYLKKYLRKSVYPIEAYKLSKEEIDAAAKLLGWNAEDLYPENHRSSQQWRVEWLREYLHNMQENRVIAKEEFKKSQEIEKVA